MAQLLKPELREKIIEASKKEFLKKGYENASMRDIAKEAGMTVGNLYRYFKNKEDINIQIVGPTLERINDLVKRVSGQGVDFKSNKFNIKFDKKNIEKMLNELADELVDIYEKNKDEFNILLLNSELNRSIADWFTNLLNHFINDNYHIAGFKKEKALMAKAFSTAIFDGIKELFKDKDLKINYLKMMVKSYLRSYISILDVDARKLLGI